MSLSLEIFNEVERGVSVLQIGDRPVRLDLVQRRFHLLGRRQDTPNVPVEAVGDGDGPLTGAMDAAPGVRFQADKKSE